MGRWSLRSFPVLIFWWDIFCSWDRKMLRDKGTCWFLLCSSTFTGVKEPTAPFINSECPKCIVWELGHLASDPGAPLPGCPWVSPFLSLGLCLLLCEMIKVRLNALWDSLQLFNNFIIGMCEVPKDVLPYSH